MSAADRPLLPIPIEAAQAIAERYGYDQVVVIARRVGEDPEPHGEHCTTYGAGKAHCAVAARMGDKLKHQVMGWPARISDEDLARVGALIVELLQGVTIEYDFAEACEFELRQLATRLGLVTLPERSAL